MPEILQMLIDADADIDMFYYGSGNLLDIALRLDNGEEVVSILKKAGLTPTE